jgi:hypothetical protein
MRAHGHASWRARSSFLFFAAVVAATFLGFSRALAQGSDNCATPQLLSGLGPHPFDTTAATTGSQGQGVLCGFPGIPNDVWFRWIAPQNGTVVVSTCGQTTLDTKLAVYGGSTCPAGSAIACSDDDCGVQSQASFVTATGTSYIIQLGSSPNNPSAGTGTLTFTFMPPATNDDCNTPAVINGPGPIPFDNSLATTGTQGQNNPGCTNVKRDLWYQWTAPVTGLATLSTCNQTAVDTAIAVYNGGTCPSAHSIACDDDGCALQSITTFPVIAGNVYMLQIGSSGGASAGLGTFTIDVTPIPRNDNCSTPENITGTVVTFDNTTATGGAEGQASACGPVDHDLWYTWTAPSAGMAEIDSCGQTAVDTLLAVYSGACPTGAAIACDNDGCGLESMVTFNTVGGTQYTIQLGAPLGASGGPGSFIINFTAQGPTSFCFGDGSAAACPCANSGMVGHGCDNSVATGGSLLTATGNASLSADTLQFTASSELPHASSIVLQGNATIPPAHFGDGLRCAGGSLKRMYLNTAVGGTIMAPQACDPSVSARSAALGDPIPIGATRNYQVYYRDPSLTFCPSPTGNTWNVSQALAVIWNS